MERQEFIDIINYLLSLSTFQFNKNIKIINKNISLVFEQEKKDFLLKIIRNIFLAIFIYNNFLSFEEKIKLFVQEYNFLKLEKFFNISSENFKKIFENIILLNNNNNNNNITTYFNLYDYSINIQNNILKQAYLYFILTKLYFYQLLFENKNFTLKILNEIDLSIINTDMEKQQYFEFYLFMFLQILSLDSKEEKENI